MSLGGKRGVLILLLILPLFFLSLHFQNQVHVLTFESCFIPEQNCISFMLNRFSKPYCRTYKLDLELPWEFELNTHEKVCFEGEKFLISTANFTKKAFENQRNVLLFSKNKLLVRAIEERKDLKLGNVSIFFCPSGLCWLIPRDLFKEASSIHCMMFSFTREDLMEIAREKEHFFLVDSRFCRYLQDLNFSCAPGIHAKFCVFDGRKVLIGSMNLSSRGAFENKDYFLVIESEELSAQLLNFLFRSLEKDFKGWPSKS